MTYGLFIENASGDVVFDSQDDLGHYYVSASGTVSSGADVPTGLVMARPSGTFTGSDRVISLQQAGSGYTASSAPRFYTNSGTIDYIVLSGMAGNIPLATSGYGIEAYNSSGPGTGNVTFSTGAGLGMFSISNIGTFGFGSSSSGVEQYDLPSGVNPDNVYVMLNNSYSMTFYADTYQLGGGSVTMKVNSNYEFNFNTDPKTIGVRAFTDLIVTVSGEYISRLPWALGGSGTNFMYGHKRG